MHKLKIFLLIAFSAVLSANSFAQWQQIPSSPSGYIYDIVESNEVLFLAHYGDGVYKSTDHGITWQLLNQGLNTPQAKMVYQLLVENDTLYAATVNGIYKSTDGGNNWTKKSNGIIVGNGAIYEFTRSIFRHNSSLLTGAYTGIYRSTDGGENWDTTNIFAHHVFPQYFVNHHGILFAAREQINVPPGYKSTDNGVSWEHLTNMFHIITFLSESVKLWAGTIHGVWLSTDNGASWEERSDGLPPDPYNSSIIRVNGNLVSSVKFGGSGIFRSTNEAMSWEDYGDGLPFLTSIEKLMTYNDKIIAATSDGLWQRDIITGVDSNDGNPAKTFALYQNYPNPFNPTTTIKFQTGDFGFVSLKIYDIVGREVAVLVNENLPAGSYEYEWDASGLRSGVYLYSLETGSFKQTRKLMVLK